jgi:hypothetical protein
MAWTDADLTALRAAIATGHRRVTFADRTVEYHSLAEMLRALRDIETEIAARGGQIVRIRPMRGTGF